MSTSTPPALVPLRVTQASLNQTAFDFPRNMANIFAAIDEAARLDSDILAMEELTLTGYDAGDDFQKTDNELIASLLNDVALYAKDKAPNLIISIGHPYFFALKDIQENGHPVPDRRQNAFFNRLQKPFNVQSFIGEGRILAMTAKKYLFGYERGYENRYFTEWNYRDVGKKDFIDITLPHNLGTIPFGRPVLRLDGEKQLVNLSHIICEEKWVASRYDDPSGTDNAYPYDGVAPEIAHKHGKEGLVFVIPNASPPSPNKMDKHEHLARLASRYADLVIDTDGLGSSGSTFAQFGYRLIVQDEKIVARGNRLAFGRVLTTTTDTFVRSATLFGKPKTTTKVDHRFSSEKPRLDKVALPAWDKSDAPRRGTEETVRMASLWLFDYMRKTRCNGIAEALSGGADSAFNSVITTIMVRLALQELGTEGFCREMKHLPYKDAILQAGKEGGTEKAASVCLQNMLTAVYMGTNNSSDETRNAARFLMQGNAKTQGIGGKFLERNVQDLLDFYAVVYAVENTSALPDARKMALQSDLAGYLNLKPKSLATDDLGEKARLIREKYPELKSDLLSAADPRHAIAYENIQARARQVLIMLIANAEGKMAIANPNLDEGRNAYATFGGDLHSGTVNLNGFIPKAEQLAIMRDLCEKGLEGIPPVESLSLILKNKPTAELQPKDEQGRVVQNDEDAMQRSFEQMNRISELMLYERTGVYKERRLNPTEVFEACRQDTPFHGVEAFDLYNMVRLSYQRWTLAQHKIHAAPITPTFGRNVDHQTSLRTPNLSGQDRAELTQLGLKLIFDAARETGKPLVSEGAEAVFHKRALLDEDFVDTFEAAIRSPASAKRTFDLNLLNQKALQVGFERCFAPIPPSFRGLFAEDKPAFG